MSWWGQSSTSTTTGVGNEFINNLIQNWYYMGMYLYYTPGIKVNQNRVIQRSTGTFSTSRVTRCTRTSPFRLGVHEELPLGGVLGDVLLVLNSNATSSSFPRSKVANNMR